MFNRPGELWLCWGVGDPLLVTTSNSDLTGNTWSCIRAKDAAHQAKLIYYGAKLISLLESLGPPVP